MSVPDHAALEGQLDLIPWLIEKGARPGQGDKALSFLGLRPPARVRDAPVAHRCGRAGDRGAADGCRESRDDPLRRGARGEAGRPPEAGEEPRARPARHGEPPRAARVLREMGCDLAAAESYGRTILHDTASYFEGVLALPRFLAELKGSGIDVTPQTAKGRPRSS